VTGNFGSSSSCDMNNSSATPFSSTTAMEQQSVGGGRSTTTNTANLLNSHFYRQGDNKNVSEVSNSHSVCLYFILLTDFVHLRRWILIFS